MRDLSHIEDKVFEDLEKRIKEAIGNIDPTQRGKSTMKGKTRYYDIDGHPCLLKKNKKSITIHCPGVASIRITPFTDVGDIERKIYRKIVYKLAG